MTPIKKVFFMMICDFIVIVQLYPPCEGGKGDVVSTIGFPFLIDFRRYNIPYPLHKGDYAIQAGGARSPTTCQRHVECSFSKYK